MIYLPVHEQSEDQLSMLVRIKSKILPADILYILLLAALLPANADTSCPAENLGE